MLKRYTMLLYGVAMKYLKDKDKAQDAVQQVFLKTLTKLPDGKIDNFKGWLYILMRNHCFQILRDVVITRGDEVIATIVDTPNDREDILKAHLSSELLLKAIRDLNDDQQRSITMFYLDQLSYQQIMERTGFTFAQVKTYIQNGKRNLKLILQKVMNG